MLLLQRLKIFNNQKIVLSRPEIIDNLVHVLIEN